MPGLSFLPNLGATLSTTGVTQLTGAPDGCDAMAMAEFLHAGTATQTLLFVAREDTRMAGTAEALGFFAPDAEIITLPAWDCLPYDRVPPHAEVAARRLAALTHLASGIAGKPRAIITTASAILQRVPPRALLAKARLDLVKGSQLPLDQLTEFLLGGGYRRAGTVREPGEFAVRGGIVDVFPPSNNIPVRLDFFGDDLDGLRGFDAITQRSTDTYDKVTLVPSSEVLLSEDAVGRFRKNYREQFGAVRDDDLLYESVSEGRRHPGMEHWLPLFYEQLDTVLDYLPADTPILLDDQCGDAIDARLELIQEYFEARRDLAMRKKGRGGELDGIIYNPLAPNALYLAADEWANLLSSRPAGAFSTFSAPSGQEGTLDLGGKRTADFTEARSRPDLKLFDAVRERFKNEHRKQQRVLVTAYSAGSSDRLMRLMQDHEIAPVVEAPGWREALALPAATIAIITLGLETGFTVNGLTVLTERDILGDRLARKPRRNRRADDFISEVSSLNQGDLVVHADHGIGRYEGLETLDISGAPHDCLRLVYAGNDKLFLPVENLEVLSRFGSEGVSVALDRLGGSGWQARKAQVKQRIRDIAQKLLEVAAARQLREGPRLTPQAGIYEEFVARFPFSETDDQDRAIGETLDDLASGRPMDRLICGDVGFGKTEVALRAAFVTAMTGRQVAVIVPTTLLARQHYRTFVERFAGLPIQIAQLSRLVAPKDSKAAKEGLASGQVDIVIGTHSLLGKTIKFRDLALVVVDEEQHFGVTQKERLKQLRNDVHVLTLTATPIPRTLQLALTGVRELSLIASPPVDRLAVRTFILPYDPVIIREAIMREHFRGGQVFYVCPRLQDIDALRERLQTLVPEV
ncbi:MAG: transcription-repair coupling factor, partial [Alphaproteobacteria bacterium]